MCEIKDFPSKKEYDDAISERDTKRFKDTISLIKLKMLEGEYPVYIPYSLNDNVRERVKSFLRSRGYDLLFSYSDYSYYKVVYYEPEESIWKRIIKSLLT